MRSKSLARLTTLFAIFVTLNACGCAPEKIEVEPFSKEALQKKLYLYDSLATRNIDNWIDAESCDGLLFSSLASLHRPFNDFVARDDSGRWFRRPLYKPECYATNQSKSTISQDMLLGLIWYHWRRSQVAPLESLETLKALFEYGQKNNWVMGDGERTRTVLRPGLRATLAEVIYKLGGPNHESHRRWLNDQTVGAAFAPNLLGFQAHLQVWHILLRAEVKGEIQSILIDRVKQHYDRNPINPLFAYAHNFLNSQPQDETLHLLLDGKYWPNDRLPTERDRASPWVIERDLGGDWAPGEGEKIHSGGDFIAMAALMLFYKSR